MIVTVLRRMRAPISKGPTVQLTPIVSSTNELKEPVAAKVTGSVPKWLSGSIMRNGAGQWDIEDKPGDVETVRHWFDGHALIHRFNIKDGEISYFNKFLRSDVYAKNQKYNRFIFGGFGTPAIHADPCKNIFQRFFSYFQPPQQTDNTNVNIWPIGDKVYSFTETCAIREVDPMTLESPTKEVINQYVTVNQSTAHPHSDSDGTVYNMGSTFGKETYYNIYKYPVENSNPKFEEMEIVAKIPADNSKAPGYYHSFGMSKNYFLFLEMPYRFNIFKMLFRNKAKEAPADSMEWHPDIPSIIKVVDKKTKENLKIKLNTKGMGIFHFGNAFEVVADGITFIVWDGCPNYYSNGATHLFNIDTLRSSVEDVQKAFKEAGRNEAMRFVFPLSVPEGTKTGLNLNEKLKGIFDTKSTACLKEDGTIWIEAEDLIKPEDKERIGFFGFEFPRYNYAFNGLKYRYLYGTGFGEVLPDRLIKIDCQTKETKFWYEEEMFPSEPVFVGNPENPDDEDDGVILSIVVSTKTNSPIFLLVLDAKTFTELGRATTDVTGIPYGFHHTFIPQ